MDEYIAWRYTDMYFKDKGLNGYMKECMHWVDGWMDDYVAEERAWGSQLSLPGSSFDVCIHHCCCSPLPHSLGPLPSAQYCRLTWVLVKWFRRACHKGDRSSSIRARLQLFWEQITTAWDEGCKSGDSDMSYCYLPCRSHLQNSDKGVSQPPCLLLKLEHSARHLVNVQ